MNTAAEALSRTVLLMQGKLDPDTGDDAVLDALLTTQVALVADRKNLAFPEGRHALTTAAALIARSGAQCYLSIPDVALRRVSAPLSGDGIVDALLDFGADLIPGCRFITGLPSDPVDMALLIGDTEWPGTAAHTLHLSGDAWTGRVGPHGERWRSRASPFGALAAAVLAAGEVFKLAMRKLSGHATDPTNFDDFFAPASNADVELAPPETPAPSPQLGRFDFVSGGAITQSALYALARIPKVQGRARVIEPETSDLTNLNRYALLRRSHVGTLKAEHLSSLELGRLSIEPVPVRYEDRHLDEIGSLAPHVLVGVDHVPSRWAVQRSQPEWLGIGATSDYSAVATYHSEGLPCARCLHPEGAEEQRPIPTVAFVSHWAGLWLAALFARRMSGERLGADQQHTFMAALRPDSPHSILRTAGVANPDCGLRCSM